MNKRAFTSKDGNEKSQSRDSKNEIFTQAPENVLNVPAVGEHIECETINGAMSGEVLLVDKNVNWIVLWRGSDPTCKSEMCFINLNHVRTIKKTPSTKCCISLPGTSNPHVTGEFMKNTNTNENSLLNDIPESAIPVYKDLKATFDDVQWDKESKCLLVLKCIAVREPFGDNCAECLNNRTSSLQALNQIQKFLTNRDLETKAIESDSNDRFDTLISERVTDLSV
ncbi:hypothetical protein Ddc_05714 [Ditylenchus destructor]|nr:hypothetical protein Ddc_05714 [Ditylenchus destructor]